MTPRNGVPYGPPQPFGVNAEREGFTASCSCRWIKWWPRRKDAAKGRLVHQKACKKGGGK